MTQGSLDLESAEVKILVDQNGKPGKILHSENDKSHHLVEEFMLLANETVAKELKRRKLPGIFRVHPDPDPRKFRRITRFS